MITIKRRLPMMAFFATLLGIAIGFTWWTFASAQADPPIPGGEELETADCLDVASGEFDFVVLETQPVGRTEEWGGKETVTLKYDIRMSGDDFHAVVTHEGDPYFETIAVNGVIYDRDASTNMQWQRADADTVMGDLDVWLVELRRFLGPGNLRPETPASMLCPENLGSVGVVDEEAAQLYREAGVEHFRVEGQAVGAVAKVDGTVAWPGYNTVEDFWVDEDSGLLVQHRNTYTYAGDPPWTGSFKTVVSGVGEPNEITAPI